MTEQHTTSTPASVDDPAATEGMDAAPGEARPVNNPTDTALTTVLGELEDDGWAGQLMPLEGGEVRCLTCREVFPASEVPADSVRRLEGVSDPADMVIVVPATCPHCDTKGVLVAHYGPDSGPEDSDVVAALGRRSHGMQPGPDETD